MRRELSPQLRPLWSAGRCLTIVKPARDLVGQGDSIRVRHSVTSPWPVLAVEHAIRQPLPGLSRCLLAPGVGVAVAEPMGKGDVVQSVSAACHDLYDVVDSRRARMRRGERAAHCTVADHAPPPVAVPDLHRCVDVPWTVLSNALCTPTILTPLDRPVPLRLPLLLREAGPSVLVKDIERPLAGASPADLNHVATPFASPTALLRRAGALLTHASHSGVWPTVAHRHRRRFRSVRPPWRWCPSDPQLRSQASG
ncbi:hypothetical protein SAURM35S_09542 [Streptomyces aurantiogriseus]